MSKITAFSRPEEQAAMIAQWRDRSKVMGGRVHQLRSKIQQHKDVTESNAKARQWVADLEALDKEQEACEKLLRDSGALWSATEAQQLKKNLRETVIKKIAQIQLLLSKAKQGSQSSSSMKSNATSAHERCSELKSFLEAEKAKLDEEEKSVTQHVVSFPEDAMRRAESELKKIFSTAEASVRSRWIPQTSETYLEALRIEREEMLHQLSQVVVPLVTSEPEVLNTAEKIMKIDYESKKRTFQVSDTRSLYDRMQMVCPSLSSRAIQLAFEESRQIKSLTTYLRHFLQHTRNVVDDIVSSHRVMVEGSAKAEELQRCIDSEAYQLDGKKEYLHAKLEIQRKVYEEKKTQEQQEQDRLEAEAEKKDAARRQKHMEEFQARLRLLEEYEHRMKEIKEKEEALQRLREEEEAADRVTRMATNRKRVLFRQEVLESRRKEHQRREKELEELQCRKLAAIQRFFESIQEKLGVEADFSRVLRATKSSEQTQSYVTFAESGAVNLHGYADEVIMKDPRVRLYHALLEAGLHKCAYGRQKIAEGYRIPRAQMISDGNPFAGAYM